MSTIDEIVSAIGTALEDVPGLNVATYFFGAITPPCAIVGVPPVTEYHSSMGSRGTMALAPQVHIFTGSASDTEGQRKLSTFVDPVGESSIKAAIEADKTLGGVVHDCIVTEFRPLNLEEYSAFQYYGGVFTLQVYAKGGS